jgi:glucokinase
MMRAGVDIGGTNIHVGLVNEEGTIILKDVMPADVQGGAEKIMCDAAGLVKKLCTKAGMGVHDLISVGIGVPGPTHGSVAIRCVNLFWDHEDVGGMLSSFLNKRTYLGNDGDCATVAEWKFGALTGTQNAVMLTLGTGLGGGFLIDGRLLHGATGCAAEIGHVILRQGGIPCNCGLYGCAEQYCAAIGLIRAAREEAQKVPRSLLNQADITAKYVSDCVAMGDVAAMNARDEYAQNLSDVIAGITNLFDPERVALGGGVAKCHGLLKGIQDELKKKRVFAHTPVDVVAAKLGSDAGIIGAAVLDMMEA